MHLPKYADAGNTRKHPIVTGRYCLAGATGTGTAHRHPGGTAGRRAGGAVLTLRGDTASVIQPYLPTRYGWRGSASSGSRSSGGIFSAGSPFVAVFLAAAWANLATKDVTA
jgi:hypothetical protein